MNRSNRNGLALSTNRAALPKRPSILLPSDLVSCTLNEDKTWRRGYFSLCQDSLDPFWFTDERVFDFITLSDWIDFVDLHSKGILCQGEEIQLEFHMRFQCIRKLKLYMSSANLFQWAQIDFIGWRVRFIFPLSSIGQKKKPELPWSPTLITYRQNELCSHVLKLFRSTFSINDTFKMKMRLMKCQHLAIIDFSLAH